MTSEVLLSRDVLHWSVLEQFSHSCQWSESRTGVTNDLRRVTRNVPNVNGACQYSVLRECGHYMTKLKMFILLLSIHCYKLFNHP